MERERNSPKMQTAASNHGSAAVERGKLAVRAGMCPFETTARRVTVFAIGLGALLVGGIAVAGAQESLNTPAADLKSNETVAKTNARLAMPGQFVAGTISGSVVDGSGAAVVGAHLRLAGEMADTSQEVVSDDEGQYLFPSITPGSFELTASAGGFTPATFAGMLHSGESLVVPPLALTVASNATEVRVTMSRVEIAEAEIKEEEKQRVLGVVPNFYVTYDPAALPLTPRQKFELAWKATFDPINIGLVGGTALMQQASDSWNGYGQGAQGFAKRYGANYADLVTGTFIGGAILPSVFKQDPRYFYKGTGSKKSRLAYAVANAFICKGDNGRWQANYSSLLGGLAAGGISNLYYPSADRGVELTFENTLIGIGTSAAANILQEFVIRKLTPHPPSYAPADAATH